MKKRNKRNIAALLLFAGVLLAATAVGFTAQTENPKPTPTPAAAQTDTPIVLAITPTATPETTAAPTPEPSPPFTHEDAAMLAKTVWGEARGCALEEQRLVVWTALQRVDAGGEFRNYNTIAAVITKPRAFVGYDENHPIDEAIYALCLEELTNWWHGAEPPTHEIYAPTAPYYFFDGDGVNNWFREEWR